MNRLSEAEVDLGMVCDAYGLPHDAVALARHLASNAELDHAVMTETNWLLAARLASVEEGLCDALMAARQGAYDGLTVEQHLESQIAAIRAVLGSDAHTEQKGTGE